MKAAQSQSKGDADGPNLWSEAKNVAFLAGIYLYFLGWVYLYVYFRHFGIQLLGLDVPLTYFFVYSAPFFTTSLTPLKLLVLVNIAILVGLAIYNPPARLWKVLMFLVTIALFVDSFFAAQESAEANARSFRQGSGSRVVRLSIDQETIRNYPKQFIDANEKGELLLLLETKDRIYTVHQQPAVLSEELPMAATYVVDHAGVAVANVDVINFSIKERAK